MTLKETFEYICANELSKVVSMAYVKDEAEYNAFMQSEGINQFRFVWVGTPVVDDTGVSGVIESNIDFNGFMLVKIDQDTVDKTADELQDIAIQPCLDLARQLFHKLSVKPVTNWTKGGIGRRTYASTYGATDEHLHGVAIRCTINYTEGITGC